MTAEPAAEDVFLCPRCGQKHRAKVPALDGGAALRAKCAGCGAALLVSRKDGTVVVALAPDEPPKTETPAAKAPAGATAASGSPAPATVRSSGGSSVPGERRSRLDELRAAREARNGGRGAAASKDAVPAPQARPPATAAASAGPASTTDAPRAARGTPSAAAPAAPAEKGRREEPRAASGAKSRRGAPESEPEAAIEAEFPPGTVVGRMTIEAAIGQGGTGTVYRTLDPTTNRYVALKVLGKDQSEAMRQRFLREIEVQANLRHQNLMPVFDRGEHEGRPWFAMELLYRPFTLTEIVTMGRNGTLSRYATLKGLESTEGLVRDVFLPVCDGIQVANVENGVIHRDLKPDNVLVDSRTLRPYVIDFGICHVLEKKTRTGGIALAPTADEAGIVGTPRYLAPEQARGAVHERTDVWGLGAILRFLVTGEPPIAAASPISRAELKRRVEALRAAEEEERKKGDERKADLCAEKLARLEDAGLRTMDDLFKDAREGAYPPLPSSVPPSLAVIIRKATAAKTAERYVNARSLASDVQAWLAGTQTRAQAEEGVTAATVVSTVGRGLRRHLVTAIVALAVGALGFLIGSSSTGSTAAKVVDQSTAALAAIDLLDQRLDALAVHAAGFSPTEAARVHDFARSEIDGRRKAIEALPPGPDRDAAIGRVAFVGRRLAPQPVHVDAPAGVTRVSVEDLVRRGGAADVAVAALRLPPGLYSLSFGSVRVPLAVPLLVRAKAEDAEREPARFTVRLPVAPSDVPERMALVVSGDVPVEYRAPPWSAVLVSAARVAPFLLDRFEVANGEWEEFLEAILSDAERKKRVPGAEFVADAERPGRFMLPRVSGSKTRDLPVRGVSPDDAVAFCAWRSKKDGVTYRLPTEAEWAVAAGLLLDYALPGGVRGASDEVELTAPVPVRGVKDFSPYGVGGMVGNVREIVTGIAASTVSPERFLTKGAGVGDAPWEASIRRVRALAHDARDLQAGVRCARDLPTKSAEPPSK